MSYKAVVGVPGPPGATAVNDDDSEALATHSVSATAPILHALIIGMEPTADWTITLYDNTAAAGTVIIQIVSRGSTTARQPNSVDMHDIAFCTGLTVVTAGGTPGDLTVVFE